MARGEDSHEYTYVFTLYILVLHDDFSFFELPSLDEFNPLFDYTTPIVSFHLLNLLFVFLSKYFQGNEKTLNINRKNNNNYNRNNGNNAICPNLYRQYRRYGIFLIF